MRKINNRLISLNSEVGEAIFDPKLLAAHIKNYFQSLFASSFVCSNFSRKYPPFDTLIVGNSLSINALPPELENWKALSKMGSFKASGLDGYHLSFTRNFGIPSKVT